jgi:adenylate kinase family enzyme
MRRILVVGISGAGKSRFARAVAARRSLPYHEMDALALGPNWSTPVDFEATIDRITQEPAWVFDSYGYAAVRDLLWSRADTVLWLDYPRRITWPRMLRRSVHRTITQAEIFNGNRETLRSWFSADHPVWHAWRDHSARRAYLQARTAEPRFAHLAVVRFRRPEQAANFLGTL